MYASVRWIILDLEFFTIDNELCGWRGIYKMLRKK
jgi:hypothetical protein